MAQGRHTLMDPPIEELLDKVDSKFTLVALGSARARQVNSYYNSLGEGLGKVVPPQVASVSGKPVSIAFEEIAAGKATFTRPDPEEEAAAGRRPGRRGRGRTAARPKLPKSAERRSDRDAGGRRRGPDRQLGAGGRGTADRRRWPDRWEARTPEYAATRRARREWRHRGLQGRRGVPPTGRCRRARRPGPDGGRHPVRGRRDLLGPGLGAGAAVALGRGLAHPAHPAGADGRPHRRGAGHGAHHRPLCGRALRRSPDGHVVGHPGTGARVPRHAHRDVGAPVGARQPGPPGRRGVEVVPPERGRLAGGDSGEGRLAEPAVIVERILARWARPATRDLDGIVSR